MRFARSYLTYKRALRIFLISFAVTALIYLSSTEDVVYHSLGARREAPDLTIPVSKAENSLSQIEERARGPLAADDPGVIQLLRTKYLDPPSSLPYKLREGPPDDQYYTSYKKRFPTWPFINSVLKDLYEGRPPGFFVEAGALDGEYLSNTLHLERHFHWTGLLVEAEKESYVVLRDKHRKAWSSPACLATKPYPHSVVLTAFRNEGRQANWLDRGAARIEKDSLADGGPGYRSYRVVQCFPSLTFFLALNVTKVDVFSLDVEGVEVDILQSFPFDKIIVDVWVIEHVFPSGKPFSTPPLWHHEDSEFIAFMEARGYYLFDMFCSIITDYIFVRRDSEVFERLGVPEELWTRRGLCLEKPKFESNRTEYFLVDLRDKRHWPTLLYSG
ncbi:protein Star-like [Penaeus monodon]|uniref:protein Star-like n=1 Tax=Penaeus monodon TaxID=6687 RepID=UPI0018A7002E|nr:protein Star-like [Penaeus monodon]